MDKKFTVYLLSSTHWDREWYQNFQGFRWRLVNMVDDLMEKLEEHPEFKQFTFDGQTIVLEDYLEIAPENKERLQKLIKDGRILIGPWYVMPDEYLVSGESLIHNMLIGTKISNNYGVNPNKYGYICDIFGHTAQMPQIFKGFNIDGALLGRGTNEGDCPAHFLWESPDGSKVTTFKLQDNKGYGAFWFEMYNFQERNTPEQMDEGIRNLIDHELSRSDIPVVLIMDAQDHQHIHMDKLLYAKKRIPELYPGAEVKIVSLCEMVEELQAYTHMMPVKRGEINAPARDQNIFVHVITNTLSSRYDIKQANDKGQALLEKWAGPLTALSNTVGKKPIRKAYYDTAYRHLIQNHPHDSICGCSPDQIHKDMIYRFDQVFEIGNEICDYGMEYISRSKEEGKNTILTIANPLPFKRKEAVTVDLWFDCDYKYRYSEPISYYGEERNSFFIIDKNGNQVPYRLLNVTRNKKQVVCGKYYDFDRHTVSFEAELPAGGTAEYMIVPKVGAVRYFDTLKTGANTAENEFIKLTVNNDGTIDIYDKRTGKSYNNQLQFADNGDIGDGWYHVAPTNDKTYLSMGGACVVSVLCDTPAKCTFTIEKQMYVPKTIQRNHELKPDIRRSEDYSLITVTSNVSVTKSSPMVDVKMTVDNTAKNHRLRLIVPTGITENKYYASEAFCVVEREVKLPKEQEMWREACQHEKAMTSFAYKKDKKGGLAFISGGGLHEIGAFEDNEGTLAVTLLRCIGQAEPHQEAIAGQLLGKWDYNFGLLPIDNESNADMQRYSDILSTGIRYKDDRTALENPENRSFFELSSEKGDICYSTLKPAENGKSNIVRIYNMSDKKQDATLTFSKEIKKAYLTDLEENILSEVKADDNSVTVAMDKWKIATLNIEL